MFISHGTRAHPGAPWVPTSAEATGWAGKKRVVGAQPTLGTSPLRWEEGWRLHASVSPLG